MSSSRPERIGIVLGARVHADGRPSPALRRRAQHGARLVLEGRLDRLILSGGPRGATFAEAQAMQRICLACGLNDAQVTLEEQAGTSVENLRFSMPLLGENCAVTLITDRYHAPRARLIARRLGLPVATSCARPGKVARGRLFKARLREAAAYAWTWLTLWG